MSRILVISSSLRAGSNSEALAYAAAKGALDAGNEVETVSLKGKSIGYCVGCLACQKTKKCVLGDDAAEIAEKVKNADALLFVTPIYYYDMSGQMKTLLDRMNPLYADEYSFRRVYLLSVAADDAPETPDRAVAGLGGWISCFEKASFGGSLFCGGINDAHRAEKDESALARAYAFGGSIR